MASGIWRWAAGAVGAIVLLGAAILLTHQTTAVPAPIILLTTPVPARAFPTRQPTPRDLVVYVSGAVTKAGVYSLKPGSRAEDALTAAGGALADADLDHVNLAAPVSDGEQLAVPHQGDATPVATRSGRSAAGAGGATPTPQGVWLLNINTATSGDFRAMPGIGKVTSDKLVAYRQQNGPYTTVDDLVKAGLHKAELAKIRARLSVQ